MRFSDLFGPTAAEVATLALCIGFPTTLAANFKPVASPNLDLSGLGRVALTGDFDSISLYSFEGQNQNSFNTNGSQSLLSQLPNGAFDTLLSSDGNIVTMCPFVAKDGNLNGIVIGGNFTSIRGLPAQGAALWNPSDDKITPLDGLNGSVNAVFCNQETSSVYFGGDFKGGNSTNAIAWVTGWTDMPFAGFNGPVNTITQAPDGNIIFGGSFTGLGNTTAPKAKDQQVINLSTAQISAGSSAATQGFSEPKNIVCKTGGQSGPGNTWLLQDNSPGFWKAQMNFGYSPTKLRVYNTHQDGRGTKTFRFTAFPIDGIMNLTYTDPETKQNATCDARCPLSSDSSVNFQDFHFVNVIGMSGFQIDISDWYGSGGGLNGIELFQDDIYAYAVNDLNEPSCTNGGFPSKATTTGPWTVSQSGQSVSQFLTAELKGPGINSQTASVTFQPDIKQKGNYTVTIYTPGCKQDNSCDRRGITKVTGVFTEGGEPITKEIFQTNDFEKYDQIYFGVVDQNSGSFRPSVTLSPRDNQDSSLSIAALRVRFQLLDAASSGGLNGLFEFDPNSAVVNTDFTLSKVDVAGTALDEDAEVNTLSVIDKTTFIGGNFSTKDFQNIFSMTDGNSNSLAKGGLNDAVASTIVFNNLLYVGGNFTDTATEKTDGLNGVAVYDNVAKSWSALGAGVNGPVSNIVPLILNLTADTPETCITVNGRFDEIKAYGSKKVSKVHGLAIWVPSRKDWLNNLGLQMQAINGQLTTATNVTGSSPLLAGTISSQGWALSDAVALAADSGNPRLQPLGLNVQAPSTSSTLQKRDVDTRDNSTKGVLTGLFDTGNGRNLTILAGKFSATATNGSTINNLAIVSGKGDEQTTTGLTSASGIKLNSTFRALAKDGDTLYAGGVVSGTVNGDVVNGLVLWNLASNSFVSQPPTLNSSKPEGVAVNAISIRPSSTEVYVAGRFESAGSIQCPSMCVFKDNIWTRPGNNFDGNVTALMWQGNNQLLVAGDLNVANNQTYLANYDAEKGIWQSTNGASAIPGSVTAISPASSDGNQFWVAGKSADDSTYLIKYDGNSFKTVDQKLGPRSLIRGLSVLSLTSAHDENPFVDTMMVLLVTGQLNVPDFGNASAALFDGVKYTPFILANSANGPGSLAQVVTEQQQSFVNGGNHMKVGFVVLIALAIALGLIFILVAIGLLLERRRRQAEGYRPAPQNYFEKTANMGRIPPEHLFGNLNSPSGPRV